MIHYCTAISKYEATDLLHGLERKGRPPVEGFKHVAWIGIEPAPSPLHRFPQKRQLILRFDDITDPADDASARPVLLGKEPEQLFSREHAEQIVTFTQALHNSARSWALLVHCTAGISRSTATALWIRDEYTVLAPPSGSNEYGWRPNKTVARLLREVSR